MASSGRPSKFKLIISLAIMLVLLIFTLQNSHEVTIRFMLWQTTMSRALILFIVFSVGVLVGYFLGGTGKRK